MSDEFIDSKLVTFSPAEREEIRLFAASILAAAQSDSEYPLGIDTVTNDYNGHDAFDAGDVRAIVFKLSREIESLTKERDEACAAWQSLVQVTSQHPDYTKDPEYVRAGELMKAGAP